MRNKIKSRKMSRRIPAHAPFFPDVNAFRQPFPITCPHTNAVSHYSIFHIFIEYFCPSVIVFSCILDFHFPPNISFPLETLVPVFAGLKYQDSMQAFRKDSEGLHTICCKSFFYSALCRIPDECLRRFRHDPNPFQKFQDRPNPVIPCPQK